MVCLKLISRSSVDHVYDAGWPARCDAYASAGLFQTKQQLLQIVVELTPRWAGVDPCWLQYLQVWLKNTSSSTAHRPTVKQWL